MVRGFQPELLFDLAADVERYPEFLRGWIAARILRRHENVYLTDQTLGLGPFRFRFVSRTTLLRPRRIDVTAEGPSFRRFELSWLFERIPDTGCRVSVVAAVALRSQLLQRVVDQVLPIAIADIVASFTARAHELARIGLKQ
jgi:coenzyme Q-binding protein COQ10